MVVLADWKIGCLLWVWKVVISESSSLLDDLFSIQPLCVGVVKSWVIHSWSFIEPLSLQRLAKARLVVLRCF